MSKLIVCGEHLVLFVASYINLSNNKKCPVSKEYASFSPNEVRFRAL